jgi:putative membrane protein
MSEVHAHIQPWSLPLAITSALVVTALVYLRGWLCLRNAFPNLIPGWRLAGFMTSLVLLWTAVGSPLATLDHQSLTIHMMKHLLLMTVAAPLVLAGAPAFPLVCGLPRLFIKSYPPLASLPARRLERSLKHPRLCWLAGTVVVIGWHLPVAFQLGMRSQWVHILEDVSFLVAGLLFWWPIVQSSPSATRSPQWSMALYLFLATLPCDILSAFLVFSNRLVYPFYLSTPRLFSLPPLQDQERAGALMWVWATFAYLIPAVAITVQILSPREDATGSGAANSSRRTDESGGSALNVRTARILDIYCYSAPSHGGRSSSSHALMLRTESAPRESSDGCTGGILLPRSAHQRQWRDGAAPPAGSCLAPVPASGKLASFRRGFRPTRR